MHWPLVRWLDFLAEYEFEISHRPDDKRKAADFLFRHSLEPLGDADEGELMTVTEEGCDHFVDLEPRLQEVGKYLLGTLMETQDTGVKRNIPR